MKGIKPISEKRPKTKKAVPVFFISFFMVMTSAISFFSFLNYHRYRTSLLEFSVSFSLACLSLAALIVVVRWKKKSETVHDFPRKYWDVPLVILDKAARALPEGPTELKAGGGRLLRVLQLFVAIVVGTGGLIVFSRAGAPKPIVYPACGVFVVVPIGGLIYELFASFNPVPTMVVSSRIIPLGGELNVRWSFQGRIDPIERLRIELEGLEEAAYEAGSRTIAERNIFATIRVVDTTSRREISGGSVTIAIPKDTMHTLKADNNEVLWILRIAGEIPRRPDVKQEYEMTILPAKTEA